MDENIEALNQPNQHILLDIWYSNFLAVGPTKFIVQSVQSAVGQHQVDSVPHLSEPVRSDPP